MANSGDLDTAVALASRLPAIIELFKSLFGGLFKKTPKPTPSPVVVVTDQTKDDDNIKMPPSPTTREVKTVKAHIYKAQYSAERVKQQGSAAFEDAYTPKNPMGLVSDAYLADINAGKKPLMWGCKFWHDLTAFDASGREFVYADNVATGLAYKTEHHAVQANGSDTFVVGHGSDPNDPTQPAAGYETGDAYPIGQGDAAWRSSLGFTQQFKAFDKIAKLTLSGSVNGVKANDLVISVA